MWFDYRNVLKWVALNDSCLLHDYPWDSQSLNSCEAASGWLSDGSGSVL